MSIHNPTVIVGTANQVLANATSGTSQAGRVTLTLPQSIATASSPTFTGLTLSGLTANSFVYPGSGSALTSTTAATNGQLLIGSTGAAPVKTTLTAGTGVSVTNGAGSITIANTGVTSFSAGTTGLTPNTATTGAVTLAGTLSVTNGGTGIVTVPANGQLLVGNGTNYTVATLGAGTGISTTAGAGTLTINNTGVTSIVAGTGISVSGATGAVTVSSTSTATVSSVGLALPSIFTVSGSPVTSTGTLTGTLNTQANNLVFAGPATGGPLTPTFRTLGLASNDINDVTITSAALGQALVYDGTKWVNTDATSSASTGNIGVTPTGGGTSWSLVSGNLYTANYTHNLGTTNVVITIYNTADNSMVVPHYCTTSSSNVVTVQVYGNTTTLKVVVIANGLSMSSSSVGTVTTQLNGATVSSTAGTLNFTGPTVNVTGASSTSTIAIGSRFTYYANSMDSPNTADYAVNAFAPIITDPTYAALTVRSFSNTIEQGVSCLVSVPVNATTITIRLRGRAQTAPGTASNVQPRVYTRLLPDNTAVGAWATGVNLTLLAIPTNANFQYYVYTGTLASVNLAAGNLYQFELTRYITGVTNNLASNFYLAEMTMEIV
jgi:hypothetical protein